MLFKLLVGILWSFRNDIRFTFFKYLNTKTGLHNFMEFYNFYNVDVA